MRFIVCKYCGQQIVYQEDGPLPEECPNCLSALELPGTEQEAAAEEPGAVILNGLSLVYQKTGAAIEIEHKKRIVLGRAHEGRDVLDEIPQISGTHCCIEVDDDRYVISDLGSTNGTFLGVSKIDCCKHPKQGLKDGDLLFLGREPFIVKIKLKKAEAGLNIRAEAEEGAGAKVDDEKPDKKRYECCNCHDYWSDTKEFTCPKCHTYND